MTNTNTDTAAEPLISAHARASPDRVQNSADEEVEIDESALVSPGRFIWGLTMCAGVSGLLFGYDTGVISSTLISLSTSLSNRPLTTLDKSLITSSTSFFALCASPLTGILADTLGRRTIIFLADILFILGALVQAFSTTVPWMIVGRSIVGVAVGSASFVVPMYISEVAPSGVRGRMVVVSALFITGGQVVAYIVGWLFSTMPGGWRWMVGLGALPAGIQFCLLFFLPETPRYLVKVGRREQARRVLRKVYGAGEGMEGVVQGVLRKVEREIEEEEDLAADRNGSAVAKSGWTAKFSRVSDTFTQLVTVGGNRRALVIACMLQGFQQLCGFNSLMYFSATIFALLSFPSPTLTSLTIASTNFLFTLLAFHFIDRIGRRRILLLSIPVMVVGLAVSAFAFRFVDLSHHHSLSTDPEQEVRGKAWPAVILVAMMTYTSAYALGLGNVPWQQSELFPLSVRSLGSGIATSTNWGCNTLVGLTFLPMMEWLTPTGTFACYAGVCAVGWGVVWRIYPETKGLGLEDVGALLKGGWGVRDSGGRRGRGR